MSLSNELNPAMQILMDQAITAALHAYAPYSNFRVGAALQLESGELVTGANVENVSFGLTICAERSALVRAVAQFGPAIRIVAVAVANLNGVPCTPCGACRQMLAEFASAEAPVAFAVASGVCVLPFSEILPLAFDMKSK
jgi:cytidine deaminase